MEKDFKSRFMPNVKFSIVGFEKRVKAIMSHYMLTDGWKYFSVNDTGDDIDIIHNAKKFASYELEEVSIYEAIPELVPDGMIYDKKSDSLVSLHEEKVSDGIKEQMTESDVAFSSRFMPNVKFCIHSISYETKFAFDNIKEQIGSTNLNWKWFSIDIDGIKIWSDRNTEFENLKQVSIYEAIPELVPTGMEYDKELDSLVPDMQIGEALENDERIAVLVLDTNSPDFIKFNKDKVDFSLVDAFAYEDLGKCLTFGAKKYSKNNWIKGDIDTYVAALERHLTDIKKAVQTGDKQYFMDKDSGLQHGSNLLCNAMFIHYFIRKELEKDVK